MSGEPSFAASIPGETLRVALVMVGSDRLIVAATPHRIQRRPFLAEVQLGHGVPARVGDPRDLHTDDASQVAFSLLTGLSEAGSAATKGGVSRARNTQSTTIGRRALTWTEALEP